MLMYKILFFSCLHSFIVWCAYKNLVFMHEDLWYCMQLFYVILHKKFFICFFLWNIDFEIPLKRLEYGGLKFSLL